MIGQGLGSYYKKDVLNCMDIHIQQCMQVASVVGKLRQHMGLVVQTNKHETFDRSNGRLNRPNLMIW